MLIALGSALEELKDALLPIGIEVAELMGFTILMISLIKAMYRYLHYLIRKDKASRSYRIDLGKGLSTSLEFKMAAEILKTVQVHELEELVTLGAIILLRSLLTYLLSKETKEELQEEENEELREAKKEKKQEEQRQPEAEKSEA